MVVAARSLVIRVRIFSDPFALVAVLRASDIIDPDVALVGSVKTVLGVQVRVRFDGTLAVFDCMRAVEKPVVQSLLSDQRLVAELESKNAVNSSITSSINLDLN